MLAALTLSNLGGKRLSSKKRREQIEHFLGERVKELSCLYGISQVIAEHDGSIERVLQSAADLLPPSWQYPEVSCARVIFEGEEYPTADFRTSEWRQTAAIKVGRKQVGSVEVYYLEEMPQSDEGPFLNEERLLIDAVSERIGRAVQRMRAEKLLRAEKIALANSNIALKEVLARVEEEKREVGARIVANIDRVIMPILYDLESRVSEDAGGYVRLLKRHLQDIASPFSSMLSREFARLTPTEIQICNMIRTGLSSKDISRIRHVSPATVSRQRENIRRKLGIANQDISLTTFLCTFMSE